MGRMLLACVSVLAFGVASSAATAKDAEAVARKFGALETVKHISLSPDGRRVVYVAPDPLKGSAVYTAELTGGSEPRRIIGSSSRDEQIYWCDWATSERIVCNIHVIYNHAGQLLGFTRAYAMNSDGTEAASLTARLNERAISIVQGGGSIIDWDVPGNPSAVLMTRNFAQLARGDSAMVDQRTGLGVEEVDTVTLERKTVERARSDAVEYISDGHGTVRIMGAIGSYASGYSREKVTYYYRKPGSKMWDLLSGVNINAAGVGGFNPYAVDGKENVVYGFADHEGFSALFKMALDGSMKRELVLAQPGVDVDGLLRIGRDRRVIGASHASEFRTSEYFDPELKRLRNALGKALPGDPSISFVGASHGEGKLMIFASSDIDPGRFYLYDKATRQLGEILAVRPDLQGMQLSPMKPVTFPAADGTQIPGYLTLPPGSDGRNLPAIVMPHGGPGSRDEWGFDWLVQFFAQRGYAVLQPNFRGSTGYGAAWYQKNGFQSWRTAIGDVNDAGRWLVGQGIARADRLGIFGWSYGGYAALQSAVLDPDLFKAIVAVAPVTDLENLREDARRYANFTIVSDQIGTGPHVKQGSPMQNVQGIKAPVLMFHGDRDQNVNVNHSRLMAERLRSAGKQVQYVEFPDLAHSLVDAAARTRMLAESDAFLRRSMGMAQD